MSQAVAARYARAFVDLILDETNQLPPDAAVAQLRTMDAALNESRELRQVLLSPAVAAAPKRAVLRRLGESSGWSPLTLRFLYVLMDHRRIGIFGQIVRAVMDELNARQGVVQAEIASAEALSEEQQLEVARGLADAVGKPVRPRFTTDPALLGGVVARIGSKVFDGSVRGRLRGLRDQLTA